TWRTGGQLQGRYKIGVMNDEITKESLEEAARIPLPQPSFAFIVLSLRAQCEMQLGLMHFGGEDEKPERNLDLARHTIDLMAILQEKTKGNLSLEEQRMLENSVTELRFRYVQISDEVARAAAQKA
ncbi:MAG TPA: DUF1844 domain-containing protein, partial [Candidatus Solibacter sp.]